MSILRPLCEGILKTVFRFLMQAAKPRWKDILLTQETLISLALGSLAFEESAHIFSHSAKLSDLTIGFVGYAAIALGFCVGGITIALTLPATFVSKLAKLEIRGEEGNALSSLLFVFIWTAFVHWVSIVTALLLLLFFGHIETTDLVRTGVLSRAVLGTAVSLAAYTLTQFLITTLTLWQVGTHYIGELRKGT